MHKLLGLRALNIVLAFLTIAGASQSALAQRQILVGFRGAVNLGRQSYDSTSSNESLGTHTGVIIGAQIDAPILDTLGSGRLSFGGQILYDQKGVKSEATSTINNESNVTTFASTYSTTLNYLEIPLLAKYTFARSLEDGIILPYIFIGPSVGIFLSGSSKSHLTATIGTSSSGNDFNSDVPDSSMSTLDVSLVGGAGLSYKVAAGPTIVVDAAYALGLTPIYEGHSSANWRSRDIRIMAGLLFPINFGRP